MTASEERLHILQLIEDGRLSAEEGAQRLSQAAQAADDEAAFREDPVRGGPQPPPAPEIERWKRWWMIPMWVGVGFIILGGLGMFAALQSSGVGFWFACAWLPFLLGVALAALFWQSRRSRWIHVRAQTGHASRDWPRNIAISFPLPTRLIAWALRQFGGRIPNLRRTAVDELILALDETTSPDNPLFVDVTEGEWGERVQVYIG